MHHFVSGRKRNYYGKDDVIVYRLNRDGQTPPGEVPGLRCERPDADLWRCLLADV